MIDKRKILVVDDDVEVLRVFTKIFEKMGYKVETAETGNEALEKIQKEKFSVFLIDFRLNDMDGTDILLKIDNDSETVKIVFSGFSDEEIAKTAADYGADDFLVKPVKPEKLLSTIQEKLCVT